MSSQLNEFRLQTERLDYDNKESIILIDSLKDRNQEVVTELEELKRQIAELKAAQKDASTEDKEKRKQEKMAMMMAKFDSVSDDSLPIFLFSSTLSSVAHSKVLSPRRTNNYARSLPSWTIWIMIRRRPCPQKKLLPSGGNSQKARACSGRPLIDSGRVRKRTSW